MYLRSACYGWMDCQWWSRNPARQSQEGVIFDVHNHLSFVFVLGILMRDSVSSRSVCRVDLILMAAVLVCIF
jgi:hypothetical protein